MSISNDSNICTSSVPNVARPKAQLKEHTINKAFKLNHIQRFKLWMSTEEVQRSSALNHCQMPIYSNSNKSENMCKLFNTNDLLIQPMD